MADDQHLTVEQLQAELRALQERHAAALAENALLRTREAATSDVLRSIARAPTDVQPVLDGLVATAQRLTRSSHGQLAIREGDLLRHMAGGVGMTFQIGHVLSMHDLRPGVLAVRDGRTIHIPDRSAPSFRAEYPGVGALSAATLHVPLLRDREAIGNITVGRDAAEPYSADEISLLETFADQAVIALENARLFQELEPCALDSEACSELR